MVGAQLLAPAQIEQAAAVPTREPLARVDLDGVRARVRQLAPVERVVVRRSWPSTLVVEVVERTPVAVVPQNGEFTLIDRDGVAFQTVKKAPGDLPQVRVDFPGASDVNTRSALTVLAALSEELREQVLAVSVAAPAQIRLELRQDRVVVWGDDTQSDTKSQVATALLKRKGQEIDVSARRS